MKNLILVAGHAVPVDLDDLARDESWFLKPFQKGEGADYVEHVRRGVALAAADPDSLLVFSGGQSDAAAGPRSEAQGYWEIADHRLWYGHPEVRGRSTTEERSRDSFENLLFSICRFREFTGAYPENVTAVGWRFKRARFEAHAAALRLPSSRFRYEGVNDPTDFAAAVHHEGIRLRSFENDPYGHAPALLAKREQRNPFRHFHGHAAGCPELAAFLAYRGMEPWVGRFPWE